ncbi:MAG TPA: adenylate cyclase regulatory domain-containing protein [Acidimicrobiales bacterium]|nr:adenylate cyclase regulatory domain-containing protein [Acidimicrobiales bacterium]
MLRAEADARLRAWGVPDDEIRRARDAGLVGLLAVAAAALPGDGKYTAGELAAKVGMERDLSKRFWRAMGFPDVPDDERVFNDVDADALSTVQAMLALGLTSVEVAIQLTRVIGSSQARIAEAMLGSREQRTAGAPDGPEADLFAMAADATLETQGRLLDYVWRRHLQAATRRRLMSTGTRGAPTVPLAVGFADLVGFTAMSQQISDRELAAVVGRFEALAFDSVTGHGGRVAKMIGDEVMFVVDGVGPALETALALAEAYADDDILSDVRVGLAYGEVLALEGDYYGPVVNLASRIVNIAIPGAVVVSEAVHVATRDDPRYIFHPLRVRSLKDIGRVRLWRARHGHPSLG